MSPTHHYQACGLTIAADAPIAGLCGASPRPADVRVSMNGPAVWAGNDVTSWPLRYDSPEQWEDGAPLLTVRTGPAGAHWFHYREGAEFLVEDGGCHIAARWEPPLTDADAATFLLGPVLGFAMRLRGVVPLHASAVVVDGKAHVFVGEAGAGKSTTAAACAAVGYPVLSDDLVPLVITEDSMMAYPSHPRITVWPDTAAGLYGSADSLPPLSPTYDKRYLALGGQAFHPTPVPVEVIYVLDDRLAASRELQIEPLAPRLAMMTLVRHTYGNYLLDASMRAREFHVLGRLVQGVPVRKIRFGDGVSELPQLCARLASACVTDTADHP